MENSVYKIPRLGSNEKQYPRTIIDINVNTATTTAPTSEANPKQLKIIPAYRVNLTIMIFLKGF